LVSILSPVFSFLFVAAVAAGGKADRAVFRLHGTVSGPRGDIAASRGVQAGALRPALVCAMSRTILEAFADRMTFAGPVPLTFERWRIERLSGLTVAPAPVPETVAFAFATGCCRRPGT
jgi:hypothetical protein